MQLYWGGLTLRLSKVYLAAVVVDHPQLDKYAGSGGYILSVRLKYTIMHYCIIVYFNALFQRNNRLKYTIIRCIFQCNNRLKYTIIRCNEYVDVIVASVLPSRTWILTRISKPK